jgi:hypothetical protein
MTDGLSILIGFSGFCLVMYIIGIIRNYKADNGFLKPDVRYFKNISKSMGIWIRSFAGIAPPAPQIERSDKYYYKPTQDEFNEALLVVHQMMIAGGWTIENYTSRAKDCEDYAMKMAVEVRNYIATTFPERVGKKGVAVGNIGYTRKDGAGHVIVMAILKNGVKYYEPYPGDKYLKPKTMTERELDSINMSIM